MALYQISITSAPDPADAGIIDLGSNSSNIVLTVVADAGNPGNLNLTDAFSDSFNSEWQIVSGGSFPVTLSPGDNHAITIRLTPSTAGVKNTNFRVESNLADDETIAVIGTGRALIKRIIAKFDNYHYQGKVFHYAYSTVSGHTNSTEYENICAIILKSGGDLIWESDKGLENLYSLTFDLKFGLIENKPSIFQMLLKQNPNYDGEFGNPSGYSLLYVSIYCSSLDEIYELFFRPGNPKQSVKNLKKIVEVKFGDGTWYLKKLKEKTPTGTDIEWYNDIIFEDDYVPTMDFIGRALVAGSPFNHNDATGQLVGSVPFTIELVNEYSEEKAFDEIYIDAWWPRTGYEGIHVLLKDILQATGLVLIRNSYKSFELKHFKNKDNPIDLTESISKDGYNIECLGSNYRGLAVKLLDYLATPGSISYLRTDNCYFEISNSVADGNDKVIETRVHNIGFFGKSAITLDWEYIEVYYNDLTQYFVEFLFQYMWEVYQKEMLKIDAVIATNFTSPLSLAQSVILNGDYYNITYLKRNVFSFTEKFEAISHHEQP